MHRQKHKQKHGPVGPLDSFGIWVYDVKRTVIECQADETTLSMFLKLY